MRDLIRNCFGPGKRSLRLMLLLWVLLPQILVWLAGGFATYHLTIGYVNQAADGVLQQATRALSRQVKRIGSGLVVDFPKAAQAVLEADPTDRLLYTVGTPPGSFILGNYQLPLPPAKMAPREGEPYFYDGLIPANPAAPAEGMRRVRISALFLKNGRAQGHQQWMLVQVARSMVGRDILVKKVMLDTLLPLSGLIVLITVLLWAGIHASLAPLNRLRSEVEGRSPSNLAPLEIDAAPEEVRALVQALNDLLASMQKSANAQQRFIADAAHQLRTPMAGLQSQTEIALRATNDLAMINRLQLVHRSAVRGSHLISQLLMLARSEPAALLVGDLVRTDLRQLVREVVAEAVPAARRAGLDLGIDDMGDDAPVEVFASARLLAEALSNILDNAIAYAGAGRQATVKVELANGRARIIVTDDGPGIAPDFRGDVFDRFVRATDVGVGCGLGLSIVREIVLRHRGTVTLEPMAPHGLRVIVDMPVAAHDH